MRRDVHMHLERGNYTKECVEKFVNTAIEKQILDFLVGAVHWIDGFGFLENFEKAPRKKAARYQPERCRSQDRDIESGNPGPERNQGRIQGSGEAET